tara:strand:+ start:100 stop:318 length:219 start_codon:yes stop_codon:yes gene_type:complete
MKLLQELEDCATWAFENNKMELLSVIQDFFEEADEDYLDEESEDEEDEEDLEEGIPEELSIKKDKDGFYSLV